MISTHIKKFLNKFYYKNKKLNFNSSLLLDQFLWQELQVDSIKVYPFGPRVFYLN